MKHPIRFGLPALILCLAALAPLRATEAPAPVQVDPGKVLGPISPYIYGVNQTPAEGSNPTLWRLGGNRMTSCNWETNASNAGSDWKQSSDGWLCTDALHLTDCDVPGAIYRHFIERTLAAKMAALVTIPMVGYLPADENGPVSEDEKAPSKRWVPNFPRKKGKLQYPPDLKDKAVYQDELVAWLVKTFGRADQGGVKFYDLDNEPAIWPSTHPRIHPQKPTYSEIVNDAEAYGAMITGIDPSAEILGPVSYGWQGMLTLQEAPDYKDWNAKFGSFLDYYLAQMAHLEKSDGRRLLHVLDVHYYPEAQGNGKRITLNDTAPESVEARLQAPRSLWDPAYVETSWITQYSTKGEAIRLIPWLKDKIAKNYPGTKLSISEYDFGAEDHVSGGLALADVLGIYGREGLYMACLWSDWKPYTASAFRLYRDYDGKGGAFGDTSVAAVNPDPEGLSVYASTDTKAPGTVWVVMINKSQKDKRKGALTLAGTTAAAWKSYGFDASGPEVKALGTGKVQAGKLEYKLEPLSATLFVVSEKP